MGKSLSNRLDQRPAFDFFPKDWVAGDNGLSECLYGAKGLWIDMMARMWLATPRGTLPADLQRLSRIVGGRPEEVRPHLEELAKNHVFSYLQDGALLDEKPDGEYLICCRSMYRKWLVSATKSEAGRMGGKAKAEASRRKQTPSKPLAQRLAKGVAKPKQDIDAELSEPQRVGDISDEAHAKQSAGKTSSSSRAPASDPDPDPLQVGDRDQSPIRSDQGGVGENGRCPDFESWSPSELRDHCVALEPDRGSGSAEKLRSMVEPQKAWGARIVELTAKTGGIEHLCDCLRGVWNGAHPELRKGVGKVKNPAAFLNKATGDWLKAHGG